MSLERITITVKWRRHKLESRAGLPLFRYRAIANSDEFLTTHPLQHPPILFQQFNLFSEYFNQWLCINRIACHMIFVSTATVRSSSHFQRWYYSLRSDSNPLQQNPLIETWNKLIFFPLIAFRTDRCFELEKVDQFANGPVEIRSIILRTDMRLYRRVRTAEEIIRIL